MSRIFYRCFRHATFFVGVAIGAAFFATDSRAQPAAPQAFDVASIRMEKPHSVDEMLKGVGVFSACTYPTNRFFVHNGSLQVVIAMAFDGTSDHVSGPEWLDSQLYSIDASVDGEPLSSAEMRPLLRKLLEDRFHLQVHKESKLVSGYVLVAAKGGPKLNVAKDPGEPHGQLLPGRLQAWHLSVQDFAHFLSAPAGRPVVDRTGIGGAYDFDFRFAGANQADSGDPDLFTAIQEQLGMKLVSEKVPVDHFVVDHVDRMPTLN